MVHSRVKCEEQEASVARSFWGQVVGLEVFDAGSIEKGKG